MLSWSGKDTTARLKHHEAMTQKILFWFCENKWISRQYFKKMLSHASQDHPQHLNTSTVPSTLIQLIQHLNSALNSDSTLIQQ